jgi:dTDP-4-amino-4,6-dideoxygalactose transaminase
MVPLIDLKAQYKSIKAEVDAAIQNVLDSSQFVLGEQVGKFEKEFAAYCSGREAVAVNSGTSALHLALVAAGIGLGDEVITVPFTFVATVAAILYARATPVYVDIDPQTFTINPQQVEHAITPRTRAILPVHLYGHPADLDPLLDIARRHKLLVIEDAAQAHGAEYKGRRVGSIGDMGCFSFYPGKNLGAYGEGGAIVTNNPEYAHTMRMLRDWGQDRKYHHVYVGYNYRMEAFQGAILSVKLRHLEAWTRSRRSHAHRYGELLANSSLVLPQEMPWARHVYHIYCVRSGHRDRLQQELNNSGVQTAIHYPLPVYQQPGYADHRYRAGAFPHSEKLAREVLSLPIYPEMTEIQLSAVAEAIAHVV